MSLLTFALAVLAFIVIVDATTLYLARKTDYPALWVAGVNVGITVLGQMAMVVLFVTH